MTVQLHRGPQYYGVCPDFEPPCLTSWYSWTLMLRRRWLTSSLRLMEGSCTSSCNDIQFRGKSILWSLSFFLPLGRLWGCFSSWVLVTGVLDASSRQLWLGLLALITPVEEYRMLQIKQEILVIFRLSMKERKQINIFHSFIYLIINDLKNKISTLKNEFKEDKL